MRDDGARYRIGAVGAAEFGGAQAAGREGGVDRRLKQARGRQRGSNAMAAAQPVEHHRRREQHGSRVDLAGAGDVQGAAVAGLEDAVLVAEIGQDVAEHVLGDHDVEIPGPADEIERGGVDVVMRRSDRAAFEPLFRSRLQCPVGAGRAPMRGTRPSIG